MFYQKVFSEKDEMFLSCVWRKITFKINGWWCYSTCSPSAAVPCSIKFLKISVCYSDLKVTEESWSLWRNPENNWQEKNISDRPSAKFLFNKDVLTRAKRETSSPAASIIWQAVVIGFLCNWVPDPFPLHITVENRIGSFLRSASWASRRGGHHRSLGQTTPNVTDIDSPGSTLCLGRWLQLR